MADITPERKMIQQEETSPDAAVTESVLSRVGGGINFINTRHFYLKEYCVNGQYNYFIPNLSIDGFFTYPFNFELIDVLLKLGPVGISGGTAEIDLKWRPENTGSWVSIFSTTPKWTSSALADTSVRIGQTVTGFTAPVLNKTLFNAYDQIRLDILTGGNGNPNSFFLNIFSRPRN